MECYVLQFISNVAKTTFSLICYLLVCVLFYVMRFSWNLLKPCKIWMHRTGPENLFILASVVE